MAELPASLDAPFEHGPGEQGGHSLFDSVADTGATDPDGLALRHEVERLLEHGLGELNEREREVLSGRFGLGDREPERLEVLA